MTLLEYQRQYRRRHPDPSLISLGPRVWWLLLCSYAYTWTHW